MANGFVFVLVLIVIIAIGIGMLVVAKKRREALQRIATIKGLRFYQHDPFNIPAAYGMMRLCGQGHSKSASNVIAGQVQSGELRYFDYKYTVGSGKNAHTYHKSGCALHAPYHFAGLMVRPENFLDKAAGFLGFEDIDLDHAEFNKKFYVSSGDKKFAYDVLNQRMMEFFLSRAGITMEMSGNCILFSYDSRLSPDGVGDLINTAEKFCDNLPDFLRQDRQLHASGSAPKQAFPAQGPLESLRFGGIEPTRRNKPR
jgi:hypothetical protein